MIFRISNSCLLPTQPYESVLVRLFIIIGVCGKEKRVDTFLTGSRSALGWGLSGSIAILHMKAVILCIYLLRERKPSYKVHKEEACEAKISQ